MGDKDDVTFVCIESTRFADMAKKEMVLDALYDSGSFLPDKETGAIMNNRFVESDGTLVDWNGLLEYLQAWEEIIGECYKK